MSLEKELLLLQGLTIFCGLDSAVQCHKSFHEKWNERYGIEGKDSRYKSKCYERYVLQWAHYRYKDIVKAYI